MSAENSEFITPQRIAEAEKLRKDELDNGAEADVLEDLGIKPPAADVGATALNGSVRKPENGADLLFRGRSNQRQRRAANGHLAGVPSHVIEDRLPPKPIRMTEQQIQRSKQSREIAIDIHTRGMTMDEYFSKFPDKKELADKLGWFDESDIA